MRAETRRTQILDATERLLIDAGNAGLTMRKIAASSGMSLGNLQYHFARREDVLLALLTRFLAPYEERFQHYPISLPNDAVEVLRPMFEKIISDPDFDRCATIYKEIWAAASHSTEMQNALTVYYMRLAKFYCELLSRVAAPETPPEKIKRVATAMLPLLEGYCITKGSVDLPPDTIAQDWSKMVAALLD